MAVDPKKPEEGVFTATFSIPSSCTCSIDQNQSESVASSTTNISPKSIKRPTIERNTIQRRKDSPVNVETRERTMPDRMKTRFKIHDEFKTDWLNFDIGRRQTRTSTATTTTTSTTTTTTTTPTTTKSTSVFNPYFIPESTGSRDEEYYYDYRYASFKDYLFLILTTLVL